MTKRILLLVALLLMFPSVAFAADGTAMPKPDTLALVLAALLAVSELMALSKKVTSNGIFQFIVGLLRKWTGKGDKE